MIKRLSNFLPLSVLKKLYFSLIHSRFSYCVGIWGSAKKKLIEAMEVMQKRALKAIFRLPFRFS